MGWLAAYVNEKVQVFDQIAVVVFDEYLHKANGVVESCKVLG